MKRVVVLAWILTVPIRAHLLLSLCEEEFLVTMATGMEKTRQYEVTKKKTTCGFTWALDPGREALQGSGKLDYRKPEVCPWPLTAVPGCCAHHTVATLERTAAHSLLSS